MMFLTTLGNLFIEHTRTIISLWPIWIIVGIVIYKKAKAKRNNKQITQTETIQNPKEQTINDIQNIQTTNWAESYEPQMLLTKNEWQQYKVIEKWASQHNYKILPKIRLADLIKPRSNKNNKTALFWKIQAKHVDFVIANENLRVIAIVELLDNSHLTAERKERDEFVKQALTSCGYQVLFTYAPTDEQLEAICNTEYKNSQIS